MSRHQLFNILSQGNKLPIEYGLSIALGYHFPAMFAYIMNGYKPALQSGNRVVIQNDPAINSGDTFAPVSTPVVATFTSDSADDDAAGTGAQQIFMLGVDSDGFFRTEVIAMAGTSAAESVHKYYCIDNAIRIAEGAAGQQGTITAYLGSQSQGAILAALGALLTAHILVPINYNYYFTEEMHSSTSNVANYNAIRFNVFGGGTTEVFGSVNQVDKDVNNIVFGRPAILLPAGTYLRIEADGGTGDSATAFWNGVMVHTDLVSDARGSAIGAPVGAVYNARDLDDIPPFWQE